MAYFLVAHTSNDKKGSHMATPRNKKVNPQEISAMDWDSAMPATYQPISDEYLESVRRRSEWLNDSDHYGHEASEEGCFTIPEPVEYHPFSVLAYGKKSQKLFIPACRSTEDGNFLMIGPEVEKLFLDRGLENAYVVWLRLQRSDLMHHPKPNGTFLMGVHPVTLENLQKSFPKRSKRWIAERLKEIEQTVGMYKESRRNPLTGEHSGFAYYPFMTYGPRDRIYSEIWSGVSEWSELDEYRWTKKLRENPKRSRGGTKQTSDTVSSRNQNVSVLPYTANQEAVIHPTRTPIPSVENLLMEMSDFNLEADDGSEEG